MAFRQPGGKRMLTAEKNKIFSKIAYYCFYIGVITEVLLVLIDKSAYVNPIEGRIFQLTFLLFTIKVILTKYSGKEYVTIGLFLLLGAVSYLATGRNEIIRFVMFLAACKDVDMQKCLKLVFYLTLSGCVLIMVLSLFGIGGAMSLTQDYGRGSVETRYTLGMGHPNALQCMIWALTVLCLYLYGEKLRWYWYPVLLGINVFFFLLTDSKTSLMVGVFAILYVGLIQLVKNERVRKLCCIGGMLLTAWSVLMSIVIAANAYRIYNRVWFAEKSKMTKFFVYLDKILTGRIHSLVGTTRWEGTIKTWKLFSDPSNNYYFDLGWVRVFYWYGIIPAVIAVVVLVATLIYCGKRKEYMAFVMIVSFAVYTMVEAHAVSVYLARNYVLFLAGAMWSGMLTRSNWKNCRKESE